MIQELLLLCQGGVGEEFPSSSLPPRSWHSSRLATLASSWACAGVSGGEITVGASTERGMEGGGQPAESCLSSMCTALP